MRRSVLFELFFIIESAKKDGKIVNKTQLLYNTAFKYYFELTQKTITSFEKNFLPTFAALDCIHDGWVDIDHSSTLILFIDMDYYTQLQQTDAVTFSDAIELLNELTSAAQETNEGAKP